jgi:hypothetical protein
VQRTDALLHDTVSIVPGRKPIGFAGTENGHHALAERGGQMRGEGIMAEHGVGTVQGADEGGKIGSV